MQCTVDLRPESLHDSTLLVGCTWLVEMSVRDAEVYCIGAGSKLSRCGRRVFVSRVPPILMILAAI